MDWGPFLKRLEKPTGSKSRLPDNEGWEPHFWRFQSLINSKSRLPDNEGWEPHFWRFQSLINSKSRLPSMRAGRGPSRCIAVFCDDEFLRFLRLLLLLFMCLEVAPATRTCGILLLPCASVFLCSIMVVLHGWAHGF